MKKKLFSILLALSLAALTSCAGAQMQTEQTTETNPDFTATSAASLSTLKIDNAPLIIVSDEKYDKVIEYFTYGKLKTYVEKQTIEGIPAKRLYEELEKMTPNGEKAEAISSQIIGTEGIRWFKINGFIYRITADGKMAITQTPFGEGEYLDFDADFLDLLEVILDYYPKNTYLGKVTDCKVTLRHVCDAESQSGIDLNIVGIDAKKVEDYIEHLKFTFTLELTSETDQDITVYYTNSQVGCIAMPDTEKQISLKAGVPQTVTFEHTAIYDSDMIVKVDNSIIIIKR